MAEPGEQRLTLVHRLEFLVPLAVVAVAGLYLALFARAPLSGLSLRPWSGGWKVAEVRAATDAIRVGDVLTEVGGLRPEDVFGHPTRGPFSGYSAGDTVLLRRRRGADEAVVPWPMPSWSLGSRFAWILPSLVPFVPLWLLGTLVLLVLRPRTLPRALIAGFNFGFSLMVVVGPVSLRGVALGSQNAWLWLVAALTLHLHWVVPVPRPPAQRRTFGWIVYSVAVGTAVAEFLRWLPPRLYLVPILVVVPASLGILLLRLLRPREPAERLGARLMLASLVFGVGPGFVLGVMPHALDLPPATGWVARVPSYALLLVPLTYVYAAFKHHLGPLELRFNRLLIGFSFAIVYGGLILGLLLALHTEAPTWVLALGLGLVSPLVWGWFRRFMERLIYGVRHHPGDVVPLTADRIARARTLAEVCALLEVEVCPTLLIRESALYLCDGGVAHRTCQQGIETPQKVEIAPLLARAGRFLTAQERESGATSWVRLVISLEVGSESVGVWLLGRRDPDDFYPQPEVRLLQTIASHAAVAVRNQQLLAAERERSAELEAKRAELQRFTYAVSHDLKSPLLTIAGFLGLLEADVTAGDAERVQADVARIRGATATMQELLEALLELSRLGRVVQPVESVSLRELAAETVRVVESTIRRRAVEVVVADDLPRVRGDRVRLRQMLQNLVENAVKFMGDQPSPMIEIGVREAAGERVCFVRDNGAGIDARDQERAFTIFERLGSKVEGTGLGLALAKRIVELHGGRIWVESEGRGRGSTFCFTLPQDRVCETDPHPSAELGGAAGG